MYSKIYLNKEFKELLQETSEVGNIEKVIDPVIYVSGLPKVRLNELVVFESGNMGFVNAIDTEMVEIISLATKPLRVGERVTRTNLLPRIPVGEHLLGKSIDALGGPLYDDMIIEESHNYRELYQEVLGIEHRVEIKQPFITGVSVVDMMIPLGKGQRELILGDRKIGKTNFLLQTMLSQANDNSICIYAAIGKKKIDVKLVEDFLRKNNILRKSVIMASSPDASLGMIFLTPYAAMSLAEYYKDQGKNVLLILDDLSSHGKFYREISLLGKKFPGRNSYPGDIFYAHAKLLERAGNFKTEKGEVSITCLPVAETIESDISGYIQTNLMSITDGHIFFDQDIFAQGRHPAVNYFLSVTRVGRQTQSKVRWGISRELNSFFTLYEKTQNFVHFGAELSTGVETTLNMGNKLLTFFKQGMNDVLDLNLQIITFCLIWVGAWQELNDTKLEIELTKFMHSYKNNKEFQSNVTKLIESVTDFNYLLGLVSQNLKELVAQTYIHKENEK